MSDPFGTSWTKEGHVHGTATTAAEDAERHRNHDNSDLVVHSSVVIEMKAAKTTVDDHVAQLLNYLKASRMQLGLLVNFGRSRLEFHRFVFTPPPSAPSVSSVASVPQPEDLGDRPGI